MRDKKTKGNRAHREHLFSIYSKNLSLYMPEYTDHFLCPICKNLFAQDDLEKLSLAHIIPKSMNGKQVTLSCRKCDNRIGTEFEKHLSREKELFKQLKENRRIYSKLDLNYGYKKYKIMFEGHLSKTGHFDMHIKPPSDVPSHIWRTRMDELANTKSKHVNISMPLFNLERRNISYIHSALLLMFSKLGYEYILSPNVTSIGQILMGNYSSLKNHKLVIELPMPSSQRAIPSIHMLVKPISVRTFVILLPSVKNGRMQCVFLPGFGKTGIDGYNNLLDLVGSGVEGQNKLFDLVGSRSILDAQLVDISPWISTYDIGDINFKGYGKFIWEALIKETDHPRTPDNSYQVSEEIS